MSINESVNLYIGTKLVLATPMTRGEYNAYRGWDMPENEDESELVYLVEYIDGGKANDDRHSGYITMSPKEVFDNAYRQNGQLTFGDAVTALKQGKKVARGGWNGKGMYIRHVATTDKLNQHLELKNVAGTFDTWVPSVSDVLAEDWVVLEVNQ